MLQNLGYHTAVYPQYDFPTREEALAFLKCPDGIQFCNYDSNPSNEPFRNGMTDFSLMNLKTRPDGAWKHDHIMHQQKQINDMRRRFNLQNLDTDAYLMNLDNNPANDPWRNGMTDDQLMNLITL